MKRSISIRIDGPWWVRLRAAWTILMGRYYEFPYEREVTRYNGAECTCNTGLNWNWPEHQPGCPAAKR